MDQQTNDQSPNAKGRGGRKQKAASDRATIWVGRFRITAEQKQLFDQMYAASGLTNHSKFLRHIIFKGYLKLYYVDENTSLIYKKLKHIHSELNHIGQNHTQAIKALNTVHHENISIREEVIKLTELTDEIRLERKKLLALYEQMKVLDAEGVVPKNITVKEQ